MEGRTIGTFEEFELGVCERPRYAFETGTWTVGSNDSGLLPLELTDSEYFDQIADAISIRLIFGLPCLEARAWGRVQNLIDAEGGGVDGNGGKGRGRHARSGSAYSSWREYGARCGEFDQF